MNAYLMIGLVVLIARLGGEARSAEFLVNGQRFTVPDGFEVELAAGTNLAQRPVSASFDDHGALYVTDSSGSNEQPRQQLQNPTHRVLRLEASHKDGQFDKFTVFADKVMFPQGCLWHAGSVYVAGPPSIWKFTDTQGHGIADQREEWFKGGVLTGCANDIHGPFLGPDGYIYWTKGAFAEQTNLLANGITLKDRAAHIYRARPDKSGLDVIMSGGMDNPVEVAFTAEGEAVFTSTFIDFSQPGFRDGIAHAVRGGVYGKENDVIEDGQVKRTGPGLLHPFYQAGPGAESGLCRYQGAAFGPEYRNNLFASSFNLRKVTRHILTLSGASYASSNIDFLVSDSQDFHPTDVLEDADGSLLVVDTGGWYKLCCPSSQLAKPDVLGAIYRVRRKGAPALSAADRSAAYQKLTSPPGMADYTLPATLKKAVWKGDATNAAWFREVLAKNVKLAKTSGEAAHAARAAAEGLGLLRDKAAVPVLLKAASLAEGDAVLEHSLIYALIQIAAPGETRLGLKGESIQEQRAALIALDQMEMGNLDFREALPGLKSSDKAFRESAIWALRHNPGWEKYLAGFTQDLLRSGPLAPVSGDQTELLKILAVSLSVQDVFATHFASASVEAKKAMLDLVAQAQLKRFSKPWIEAVRSALAQENPALIQAALPVARELNSDSRRPQGAALNPSLLSLAGNSGLPKEMRLDALFSSSGKLESLDPSIIDLILQELNASQPPAQRGKALQVLVRAKLDKPALAKVTDSLPGVSPLELLRLLSVFEAESDESTGLALVKALQNSKSARNLPPGNLLAIFSHYPATVQTELGAFLKTIGGDVSQQAARLNALLEELKSLKGDVRRGQLVFNGPKASCMACHKVGYVGGVVGPDLTSVGSARTQRDLLEAIIYPSASFVRSYEPMIITTKQGETLSGIIKREAADEIILATGANAEVRILKSDVAEQRPGSVSVMPQGLDEQLTKQELADLIAFLKPR